MRKEFLDYYEDLFKGCSNRLRKCWHLKLRAIKAIKKMIKKAGKLNQKQIENGADSQEEDQVFMGHRKFEQSEER